MATMTGARAGDFAPGHSGVPPPRGVGRDGSGEGVHWATPISAWASMASAARRYSSAGQSSPRWR